jgi:hypothetical protein
MTAPAVLDAAGLSQRHGQHVAASVGSANDQAGVGIGQLLPDPGHSGGAGVGAGRRSRRARRGRQPRDLPKAHRGRSAARPSLSLRRSDMPALGFVTCLRWAPSGRPVPYMPHHDDGAATHTAAQGSTRLSGVGESAHWTRRRVAESQRLVERPRLGACVHVDGLDSPGDRTSPAGQRTPSGPLLGASGRGR